MEPGEFGVTKQRLNPPQQIQANQSRRSGYSGVTWTLSRCVCLGLVGGTALLGWVGDRSLEASELRETGESIEVESIEMEIEHLHDFDEHDPYDRDAFNEVEESVPPLSVDTYTLGIGDRIQVDVFESPEYSGEFQVLADGTVRLPFAGGLQVRGLTIDQVSTLISQRYSAILRRPIVSVQLLEARPITLALVGEVNSPGAYTITAEDVDGQPTVTKAIQIAGGITPFANIREVRVQRNNSLAEAPDRVIRVDLWQLLQEADLAQDLALQDGDRIIVPEASELLYDEISEVSDANFSPGVIPVNVVGEVDFPGQVEVEPNAPLNQALLAAGGFNNEARRRKVELVRLNPNGTVSRRTIEVDLDDDINEDTNPPLRPNDTVIVERSRFVRVTDAIGRAVAPFTSVFSLFRILGL